MKKRHWDRLGNGGLTFTELGFGAAPLGNLYTAISDPEADAILASAGPPVCAISIPRRFTGSACRKPG